MAEEQDRSSDDSEGVISSAIMAEDEDRSYILCYLPLYKAALTNDWEAARRFHRNDLTVDLTAIITVFDETALHIAVGTKTSHRFVTELVDLIEPINLRASDCVGNTALHYAAMVGNIDDARTLVRKDPHLPHIRNKERATAMQLAAWHRHKETLGYLLEVARNVVGEEEDGMTLYTSSIDEDLLTIIIIAGFYDIALMLINDHPDLQVNNLNNDWLNGLTALQTMARHSEAFPSGRNWWFWNNLIYSWIPENSGRFNSIIKYVPFLKSIRDTKLVEKQANLLMKAMIERVMASGNHKLVWDVLGRAMLKAAEYGIHELIEECVWHYPGLIWYHIKNVNLFTVAVEYRQVKVYNSYFQLTGHSAQVRRHIKDNHYDSVCLAAKRASPDMLDTITGAALQMQRELQWFKEVKKVVSPYQKDAPYADNHIMQFDFTYEHRNLVEQGEKWMKDTATSSTLVAALIVTVAFAAIFTLPGGNSSNGMPNFVRDRIFMVFALANSLALFSSVTSVLMFTALLTSRYSEDDFLYALPKRMTIGLLSLFISIASLMMTFCAALVLVMRAKVSWIAIPAGVAAVVPVSCFALLQFPLLVELVLSTFGPNIFHRKKNAIFH